MIFVAKSVLFIELQESNVRLKLTIVDSVGFGDQINKEDSYKPIVEYINQQFENYLQVQCQLYFQDRTLALKLDN